MSDYRWAYGFVDYATFVADDTNIVANFPKLGERPSWMVRTTGAIDRFTQRVTTPSVKDYALGSPSTLWDLQALNYDQVEWLMDNRFTGGVLTAPATIMTYRSNNPSATGDDRRWCVLQGYARLESGLTVADTNNVNDRWMNGYNVRFIRCTFLEAP